MIFPALFFYLFAGVCIAAAVMVIAARNPVHSVLFLILAFVNAAALFILLGAEFLAMILIIVYVGAVLVLFLFVVMMLDVDFAQLRQGLMRYLPIGAFLGGILLIELVLVLVTWTIGPDVQRTIATPIPPIASMFNAEALGHVLYTRYVYFFQAAGVVLLVAMIGAIVLTLRHKPHVKRQNIADQIARATATATYIVKVRPGQRLYRVRGERYDHRPRPLSHGRRHPVHDRHFRHFPQPQERDHHHDVDRADPARGQRQPGRLLGLPRRSGRPSLRAVGAHRGGGGSGHRARHSGRLLPQSRLDRSRGHQSDEGLSAACITHSFFCRSSAPSSRRSSRSPAHARAIRARRPTRLTRAMRTGRYPRRRRPPPSMSRSASRNRRPRARVPPNS